MTARLSVANDSAAAAFGSVRAAAAMPRVLIDGYFFDRAYGFGRYVRELVHALDRWLTDFEPVLLVPSNAYDQAAEAVTRTRLVARDPRFFPLWEQVVVPLEARAHRCAIVHFPYQSTALAWPRSRTVTTIHDLMFLRPTATSGATMDRLAHLYRGALFHAQTRRASGVLAVSHATQQELMHRFGQASTVVDNVCDAFVSARSDVTPAREGRYFLHRGDAGPHKNTRRVVEAFAEVRRAEPHARLLIYGPSVGEAVLSGVPRDGIELLGRVSDERLAALYKGAVAVLVPSLEEGFGLSIVEALGFGTTVVTSNIPPMNEVVGSAGLLVDPHRVDDISAAMSTLLQDGVARGRLIEEGRRRYEHFSAQRFAREVGAVYRAVHGN